tara:strand:- start:41 stop:1186 length:1146 start_codon:yes stop_codon:yes gene_type:complete
MNLYNTYTEYVLDNNILNIDDTYYWGNTSSSVITTEPSLDIQTVLGICQFGMNKNDTLYIYNGSILDLFDMPYNDKYPKIWSCSISESADYGKIEESIKFLQDNKNQIFVSSGDGGAGDNYSHLVSSGFPMITSVGGTNLYMNESTLVELPMVYINKTYCATISPSSCTTNNNSNSTSGGGVDGIPQSTTVINMNTLSNYVYIRKEYELKNKALDDYYNNIDMTYIDESVVNTIKNNKQTHGIYQRSYPDISMSGNNFISIVNDACQSVSGTSASAPFLAATYAIIASNINNKAIFNNNFNYYIYSAYNESVPIFKPVVSLCPCTDSNINLRNSSNKTGYPLNHKRLSTYNGDNKGHGYDCVVGLGSLDVTKLYEYIKTKL